MTMEMTSRNITRELTVLEAMLGEFEDYIIDGEVFRTVLIESGSGNQQYQMSGGDVLARIFILQAIYTNLTGEQKDMLNSIVTQLEKTKHELPTRFQQLLQRELKARLDMLEWSMDESDDDDEDVPSPADKHNLRRVVAIRQELGDNIPNETAEELSALEQHLQAEIDLIHQGAPEIPDAPETPEESD